MSKVIYENYCYKELKTNKDKLDINGEVCYYKIIKIYNKYGIDNIWSKFADGVGCDKHDNIVYGTERVLIYGRFIWNIEKGFIFHYKQKERELKLKNIKVING